MSRLTLRQLLRLDDPETVNALRFQAGIEQRQAAILDHVAWRP